MIMEEPLKKALQHISDVISFLEKIKEKDKKLRKEKDELVYKLQEFLRITRPPLPKSQKPSFDRSSLDEETYDDVDTRPSENYDDVETNQNDVYDETEADGDIYVENEVEKPNDDYNDVVVKPSPPPSTSIVTVPIPCEDLKDQSIAEHLEQKSKGVSSWMGTWQKRWCVVQQNVLYIYDSPKDKKQKEAFALNGYVVTVRDEVTKETKRKERCFELKNYQYNKVYDFCATDKETVSKWKRVLEQASKMPSTVPVLPVQHSSPSHNDNEKKSKFNPLSGIKNKMKTKLSTSVTNPAAADEVYVDNMEDTYNDTEDVPVYDDTSDQGPADNYVDTAQEGQPAPDDGAEEFYEEFSQEKPVPPVPDISTHRGQSKLPPRPSKSNADMGPAPPVLPKRDEHSGSGTLAPRLPPRSPSIGSGDNRKRPQRVQSFNAQKNLNDIHFDAAEEDEKYKDVNIDELYQGMWDCLADDNNELSFKRGQIVHIISKEYDNSGWWIAQRDDQVGLVPKTYLMEAYEI